MKKIFVIITWCTIAQAMDIYQENIGPIRELMQAIEDNDLQLAKIALRDGAELNIIHPLWRMTPIVLATVNENKEMVKLLISAGADLNKQVKNGSTALFYAADNISPEVLKLLFAAGADVSIKDNYGKTIFGYASSSWLFIETKKLIKSLQAFLDNPLKEIEEHPENRDDYFVWSIAYKKDDAYNYLIANNPDLLDSSNKVIRYFLQAARVGNEFVLNNLKPMLNKLKPGIVDFVYLKALEIIAKFHPELMGLLQERIAEKIIRQ